MKTMIAGACALAALTGVSAAAAADLPARRAGLWEMHISGGPMAGMEMTGRTCVGPNDARGAALAQQRNACGSAPTIMPAPGGWAYHTVCKPNGGRMTIESSGVITGDFHTGYTVKSTTKMNPAPLPAMAQSSMTATSRWLGPCPAGMKPGQTQMTGGPHVR